MNTLKRVLIEKTGCENGWERAELVDEKILLLTSARHNGQATIELQVDSETYFIKIGSIAVSIELAQTFHLCEGQEDIFGVDGSTMLGKFLHRAAQLYYSLPDFPMKRFEDLVAKEVESIKPEEMKTEVERQVKQRLGQQEYRNSLLSYWKNACAVTGINIPEILRASHAKPWSDCQSDAERLNVFNGFLLTANLDALFDRGLITFDDSGNLICSEKLTETHKAVLGLNNVLKLRWIHASHLPFLHWHQQKVFQK